jgi:CMP/dCMP kinase
MNVNPQAIAAMRAVTISREYGSGGGEIAARLARRLNWQLIDHAIIEQTARELEVHETEVEKHDEEYVEGTQSAIQLIRRNSYEYR